MNKKANLGGMVTTIVGLVLAVVLLTNLAFPQVRTMTDPIVDSQSLTAHILGAGATTSTLTNTDLVINGVSIAGLTVTSNYTVNYTTRVVTVLNTTANGTYTAAYSFYGAGYIESAGTRAMAAVIILLLIVGLVMGGFRMFGLI